MENTIIERENIRSLADHLNEVVSKRKEVSSSLSISIKFAREIITNIEGIIEKAQKQLIDEGKEIKDIEKLGKKLQKLKLIDTASLTYDEDILPYVKGKSIITSYSEKPNNSLESIKAEMFEIAEKINGYVKEGKYEKEQENLKVALEEEKVMSKVQSKERMREIESVQIKVDDRIGAIEDISNSSKSEEDYVSELVGAEKMCELCHTFNRYTLILSRRCSICLKCLKESLLKGSNNTLSNTFEAHKKKHKSMYACPNHGTPIEAKVLEAICGEEEVERASIEAMKRQLQECIQTKLFYPIICMCCKNLIKNETDKYSVVSLCTKHKLCYICNT
jgi:hypothetical protein